MAQTTANQVLHNIARDYKTKTGDTTEINYGNVETKVNEAMNAGSQNISFGNTAPTDTTKLWVKLPEQLNNIMINPEYPLSSFEKYGDMSYSGGGSIYSHNGYLYQRTSSGLMRFNIETKTDEIFIPLSNNNIPNGTFIGVGDYIYIFGGVNNNNAKLNSIKRINLSNGTVTTLTTTLPKYAYGMGATFINGDIYLFGGVRNTTSSTTDQWETTIWKFNVNAETISTYTDDNNNNVTLPYAVYANDATYYPLNNKVYVFGCNTNNWATTNKVMCLDFSTKSCSQLPFTMPTAGITKQITLDNKIYVSDVNQIFYEFDGNTLTPTDKRINIGGASNEVGKVVFFKISGATDLYLMSAGQMSEDEDMRICYTAQNIFEIINNVFINPTAVYYKNNAEIIKADAYLYDGTDWVEI